MKKIIIALILCMSPLKSAFADVSEACMANSNSLSQDVYQSIENLLQASAASTRKVDLTTARITYGSLGIGAGQANIFLNISEGKIVDLSISARVGMLGINTTIDEKVTITDLMQGEALRFYMDGAAQPALKVTPNRGFGEHGGSATLEIWNGERYLKETIVISDQRGGTYKAYLNSVASANVVTGMKVNMRGYSVSDMYVGSYSINTN